MTDDEAVAAFESEQEAIRGDAEVQHADGDKFIAKVLSEHGFPKLAASYKDRCRDWWYA